MPLRQPGTGGPRLHGILTTYRRPAELADTLVRLGGQSRLIERLVVADNGRGPETEGIVDRSAGWCPAVEHVAMPENVGPAGAIATGMRRFLEDAADGDWIVVIDDDDPPRFPHVIEELERFAEDAVRRDPRTAAVGLHGARFDWSRGRLVRIGDRELDGPVPLDYLGGNALPFFRVAAVREVGPFLEQLFWGWEELEYGLRLRGAGYRIYGHGDLWRWGRGTRAADLDRRKRPLFSLREPDWRRYYEVRNLVHLLRIHGRPGTALRVGLTMGVAKPLANLPVRPRMALRHLALSRRALRDGWTGRLGRTVEPEPWGPRPVRHPAR
ncbi:MAG: glycosyltransferase family 2 protein [Actinomycetota bacterium]